MGAGKVGKLNDHHTKQPYVALKAKWETSTKKLLRVFAPGAWNCLN